MIFVLFAIGSSDLLCFGTASEAMKTKCTVSNTFTDGMTAFTDLTKTYEIYATEELTLSAANFRTVTKIFNDGDAAVQATASDVESGTKDNLVLEKIELSINGNQNNVAYTIKNANLDQTSVLKPGAGFNLKIEKLISVNAPTQVLAAQLLPTSKVVYVPNHLVAMNFADGKSNIDGADISDGMVAKVLVLAGSGASLSYSKPAGSKLLEGKVPIVVQSIAAGQTITFEEGYDVDNAHWKVAANVTTKLSLTKLEDARKVSLEDSQQFFTLNDGTRVKLSKFFDEYCVGVTKDIETCKERSLKDTELSLPFYQTDKQSVTLAAYGTNAAALSLVLDDVKGLDVAFKSGDDKKAKIEVKTKPTEDFKANVFEANSVELTFKAAAASVVNFGRAKFFNSVVASDEGADKALFVSVLADELTSDISSLSSLKTIIKKQIANGVIEQQDVEKVSIANNAKSMDVVKGKETATIEDDLFKGVLSLKISGGNKDSDDKRVQFEISSATTSKLLESKTFGFNLNISKGLSLFPLFVGDWSPYTIEVHGGDNFVYDSATKEGSKSPKIENLSDKTIIVDGKEVISSKSKTATTKSGLSAGPIAGIVIACVVVVAAIAVSVFFVLKKRAKIAN